MRSCDVNWFLIRLDPKSERRARMALKAHGLQVFDAVRRSRPCPVSTRGDVEGPLFPGFCFVRFPGQRPETLLSLPGITFILRHEKGRPLSIPGDRIADLETYCNARNAEKIPETLRILDVLSVEDRLSHLVDWLASPPRTGRRQSRDTGARPSAAGPALVGG